MKSPLKRFLEASGSPHQDLINDVHRAARKVLDIKDLLEKHADAENSPEIKMSIKKLQELDLDIEGIAYEIEKLK